MKYTILFFVGFALLSCNNSNKKTTNLIPKPLAEAKVIAKTHPGKRITKQLCVSCHNPSASENDRIAPPLVAIKAHYITKNTTKEAFIAELKSFLKKPAKDKAKLRGAVKRFGVMPLTPLTDKQIEQVGEYLYDYEIPEPKWFKQHWEERHTTPYINSGIKTSNTTPQNTKEKGLAYAINTKKVLGKNLMRTIKKQGTVNALAFCNERAYPLTDSMAISQKANIKRVSDKPRNLNNSASKKELEHIDYFKKKVAENEDYEPIVEHQKQQATVYYPIVTNGMCLQCHGSPHKDIKPKTLKKLEALYPNDKAIGYGVNQVRGIWSVTFDN